MKDEDIAYTEVRFSTGGGDAVVVRWARHDTVTPVRLAISEPEAGTLCSWMTVDQVRDVRDLLTRALDSLS